MGAFASKSSATKQPDTASKISSIDRTMLDLKNTRDRLYRYRSQLERDKERILQQAQVQKQLNNKTRALGLLRLKKYKQTLLDSLEEQLFTLQQIMSTIDSKQNETQLLTVLKSGKDCLKELHEQFNVDQVLDLMGQVQDTIETEREISDILAQVPDLTAQQEQDAQLELETLMNEITESETTVDQLPQVPSDQPLPTVPSHKLPDIRPTTKVSEPEQDRVALPG
jgi:charged multivesicular body protein 6